MAILRSLGFRPREVFLLYFGQTFLLGLAGSALGVVGGAVALALVPGLLTDLLPQGLGVSLWQPAAFLRGLGLGLGTALLFSFGPLAAVRRVRPLRVLRQDIEPIQPSRWARILTAVVLTGGIASTAIIQASSIRHGLEFTAGVGLAAGVLSLISLAAIRLLRVLPQRVFPGAPVWVRHGVAALARPGAGTVGAVVALGLGVLLLLGIWLVENGLTAQLSTRLPANSPSAFLIDIQSDQWLEVQNILRSGGAESINSAPVVTARLARIEGKEVDELAEAADSRARRWALTREQRITYLSELAPDNEVIAGGLWSDPDRFELSVEREYAGDLGLAVGSDLVLDVQGVPLEFTVTSLRSVDWGTFDLNFFLVAEPGSLDQAPQYRVATVKLPLAGEQAVQDRLAAVFPNVTLLRIRDVLDKVRNVLDRLALGVRFLGGFTVLAGLVILSGAVSASSIRRSREIALLKTLGMIRREVALMFTVEFAVLGLLAGAAGAIGGVFLSRAVLTRGMEISWVFEPLPVAVAIVASIVLAAVAAVLAGGRALSSRPLEVLRGED
jgi:putative ABC transport system permease protein